MSRRFRPHVLSGIRTRLLRLRDTGYLKKWLILGGLTGIVAGLGAVVFITALEAATGLFLESLGGYTPPSPIGEGNAAGSAGFDRPWAIPLVVALGGLISGILTVRFAPEAEGHGTDAAIEAFHHNPGGVQPGSSGSSSPPRRSPSDRKGPPGARARPRRSAPGSAPCSDGSWS